MEAVNGDTTEQVRLHIMKVRIQTMKKQTSYKIKIK